MSERIIPISPYIKADNLVSIGGHTVIDGIDEQIEIPEKKHLNLYNYTMSNGELVVPRNHKLLRVFLKPIWEDGHNANDFNHLLLNGETTEKVLRLKLQIWCKNTRWCSNQLSLHLSEVGRKEVYFEIPILEVKEEIVISGFVTRESHSGRNEPRKANAIYSVLSNCEDVSIQIDEKKEIGGNHLPIKPENIGELLFDLDGMDSDFDLPVIKYSEEFKEYFVRDTLKTVNITFMMSMFFFLDSYLKWLIFKCRYDSHDKNHKGLIESFSKYCEISRTKLIELIEEKKYSENQIKQYLILSANLFRGIQINSPIKYAKELKQMIKSELK